MLITWEYSEGIEAPSMWKISLGTSARQYAKWTWQKWWGAEQNCWTGLSCVFCRRKPSVLGRGKPAEGCGERQSQLCMGTPHPRRGSTEKQGRRSSAEHCTCMEVFALGCCQSITSLQSLPALPEGNPGSACSKSHLVWSRQPLAGPKGMSNLFREEACFESQWNLTPWISRDSAWGLRQKSIPFLKGLGKSRDLCGKAGETAGEKRKITCISGLFLPDIYKLWVMQLRGNFSHSKEAAWFKRAGGLQFALWFNPQIKLPSRGWISGRNLGVHFLGAQTLIRHSFIASVTYHLSIIWPCAAHGMERLMCKTHHSFNRFGETKTVLRLLHLWFFLQMTLLSLFYALKDNLPNPFSLFSAFQRELKPRHHADEGPVPIIRPWSN